VHYVGTINYKGSWYGKKYAYNDYVGIIDVVYIPILEIRKGAGSFTRRRRIRA